MWTVIMIESVVVVVESIGDNTIAPIENLHLAPAPIQHHPHTPIVKATIPKSSPPTIT